MGSNKLDCGSSGHGNLKKLKSHNKMLSTLFDSYKDNIDVPYKEEFKKNIQPGESPNIRLSMGQMSHSSGFQIKTPLINDRMHSLKAPP